MSDIRKTFRGGKMIRFLIDGIPQPLTDERYVKHTVPIFPAAIPYDQWPIWAKAFKQLSNPFDKGIGDVVQRIIGDVNSEAFKAWHKNTFGKDCNCTGRRNSWNLKFPLPK